jgi:hypothetical protein
MQNAVDVPYALGSQPTAPVPAAVVHQGSVERREVAWSESLQQHTTERRDDVPLYGHAVAGPGGRPNAWRPHCRQPLVD